MYIFCVSAWYDHGVGEVTRTCVVASTYSHVYSWITHTRAASFVTANFVLLYLTYPLVMQSAFSVFYCVEIDGVCCCVLWCCGLWVAGCVLYVMWVCCVLCIVVLGCACCVCCVWCVVGCGCCFILHTKTNILCRRAVYRFWYARNVWYNRVCARCVCCGSFTKSFTPTFARKHKTHTRIHSHVLSDVYIHH